MLRIFLGGWGGLERIGEDWRGLEWRKEDWGGLERIGEEERGLERKLLTPN